MSRMKIKLRYPVMALAILAVFAGLYAYISMNIEASLLEREIRLARYEKRDWERKNSAIRAEIARLEGEGYETIYWKLYGALPFYEDNTIIYVDLDDLNPGPNFYENRTADDRQKDINTSGDDESREAGSQDSDGERDASNEPQDPSSDPNARRELQESEKQSIRESLQDWLP